MKTTVICILATAASALLASTSQASTSVLRHRDPNNNVYSTGAVLGCPYQTPVKTLTSTYDYCGSSDVIIIGDNYCGHHTGGPTPTCGANPYRITSKLYRDGGHISTISFQAAGAWAQQSFDSLTLTPGNYYVEQTLEKRNGTCIGWKTVESRTTNTISVGHYANSATACFAAPASGTRVRLRNKATQKCAYVIRSGGGLLHEWGCWDDPAMTFVLDAVGNGGYRIRWEADSQCIFTSSNPGAYAADWGCWDDPSMVFGLIPAAGGGYRLWNFNTNRSLYSTLNDAIRSTVDSTSNDSMVYFLDPVTMSGGWTGWLDRDDASGSGDYELRTDFPAGTVCASPTGIVCQTVNGLSSWDVGEGPTTTCHTTNGFSCVNASQPDAACEDYRVKFYCP